MGIDMIRKRDGREVPFDQDKIEQAIFASFQASGSARGHETSRKLTEEVVRLLENNENISAIPSVEQVQDTVEQVLMRNGFTRTAKSYILYRAERSRVREMNSRLMRTFGDIVFKDASESDIKRENANINGDTAMGAMLKFGSEGAKQYYEKYVMDPRFGQAHMDGDIHIHDMDFYTLTTTCCQIELKSLFKGGFSTGHGYLREPQDITSYAALACIAIQANQNDQHGGQAIVDFDYGMAPGVKKTFIKRYRMNLSRALELLLQRLDEAGVAENTVIALTGDHYPYGLTEDEYNELAGREMDLTFEKYRNSFICYVPGLSENIVVDEYCSTADILPTLLNLFGVDYDSRLLAGTDVLSSGLHVAVLSDKSFLTKTFRYDAGTETVIPADENTTVSDKLAEAYRLYVDSRFQLSGNILNSDYYAHVFSKESSGGSLADTVVFTDIKSIFNQASVLYMYRKGYVEPEAPDTFGGKATARLGEFIDVLYRIAGRPETDNTALPADYENEEFNAAHPYYNAVCWAYQTRLLRQNDPNAEYDDKVDYQTACVLIRRYAIMAGVDTGVNQTQLRQLLRDAPDLGREAAKAMLWCDEKDITTRDSSLDELLASAGTRISRYQMTSFLFYLCTYELDIGS